MRWVIGLIVASVVSLATFAPAFAQPNGDTPQQGASTLLSVLSAISAMGDDTFSTMDTPLQSNGNATQHYGPYASSSPDSSTCPNDWANDTFDRHFTVRNNGDGTFTVVEQFKNGNFVTAAGPSPGGCDTNPGGTIVAGISGGLHGYEIIAVTGMQTSTDSSCIAGVPSAPCTTSGFIGSHFAGAFTVGTFFFHYNSGGQPLVFNEWKNASCDRGGNQGDIASTTVTGLRKSPLC